MPESYTPREQRASLATRVPSGIGWRHPHYAAVLEKKPLVGFLQVHSENFFGTGGAAITTLAQAREHYPISLHGVGLSLGSAVGIDAWHLDQLAALVERIEPIRVSDHACFARGLIGDQTVHAADLLPIPFTRDCLDVLCVNVSQVQDRLQQPLLVENLSAYLQFTMADYSEVEFLNALVQRTGCQLLLDVNNVFVNALNAQTGQPRDRMLALSEATSFLDALSTHAIGEMHLAGHCEMPGIVIDDHGSAVCDEVWQLYTHAVQRFGDAPALIEWDTNIPALDMLLAHVQRMDAVRLQVLA
jgi:uncharacterized protein